MKQIKVLFSAYRRDQFSDPDGYAASLVAVLEAYPDDVIVAVTDPRTGVQRESDWPPTIARIVTACEVLVQEKARRRRLESLGKPKRQQLEAPAEDRPTLEELKAKYGDNYGLKPPEERKSNPAPSWQEIATMYHRDPDLGARLLKSDLMIKSSQEIEQ